MENEIYQYIKGITIRGSKIQKIINDIKNYEMIFTSSSTILVDLDNDSQLEMNFYTVKECSKDIRRFINFTFERKTYEKSQFKKVAFSGSKIVTVLSYIDHQLVRCYKNIELISDNFNSADNLGVMDNFWKAQYQSLLMIKRIILSNYIQFESMDLNEVEKIFLKFIQEEY